ncbi:MAG: hypothetical protein II865_09075 [Bacteroidales bacterium]|nr:hypothetical protein [Bacteroidales bacterium]
MFFDWNKGIIRAGKVLGIVEILRQYRPVRFPAVQPHQCTSVNGRSDGQFICVAVQECYYLRLALARNQDFLQTEHAGLPLQLVAVSEEGGEGQHTGYPAHPEGRPAAAEDSHEHPGGDQDSENQPVGP